MEFSARVAKGKYLYIRAPQTELYDQEADPQESTTSLHQQSSVGHTSAQWMIQAAKRARR